MRSHPAQSFTHFIRDRYNLSYNVSNWIHEPNDDIKPLDMHAKPFCQSCDVIRMNTTNKGERPKTGCFPLFV